MKPLFRRTASLCLAALVVAFTASTALADTLGSVTFRRADSAAMVGSASGGWLNVVNASVDVNTALTSAPLENTGIANIATGAVIEYRFTVGVTNGPGPDLVVFDARFDSGTMTVATSRDAFATTAAVAGWTTTGVSRSYYYRDSSGTFTATIYAGTVDLSDLGVPTGATVGTIRTISTNSACDPIGIGALTGSESACNGVDDDGDGLIDEDYVPVATTCGTGACARAGTTSCVSGTVTDSCTPGTPAASDATCNGVDDDCNGVEDEDYVSASTSCGTGACAATGTTSCVSGTVQNSCTPGIPAAGDATCNGVDDDCDGVADEGFVSTSTSCGIGPCAASGVTSCVSGAVQDSCTPGTPAADVTCNGVDDDCDGVADEGFVPASTACGTGACAAAGVTSCLSGTLEDSCTPGTPAADDATCDGVDDDCDGTSDEDGDCVVDAGVSGDAGGARDASARIDGGDTMLRRRASRGCGCHVVGSRTADRDVAVWLGLLLSVGLRLRLRRRRRPC